MSRAKDINVLTVIQARLGSSRLPGKVLFPLGKTSVLVEMYNRVKQANRVGQIVIAIPTHASDDALEEECRQHQIPCFRGSHLDLLDRHYQAALHFKADAIVKIPSDCPLIDPRIIDSVLNVFVSNYSHCDFVSNLHPQTFPDGNDVEVMKFTALRKAWLEAKFDWEREHTTPYLWDNPTKFRCLNVETESGIDYSMRFRWTLDHESDYRLIQEIYNGLHERNPSFSYHEILNFLQSRPALRGLNSSYLGNSWYLKNLADFREPLRVYKGLSI